MTKVYYKVKCSCGFEQEIKSDSSFFDEFTDDKMLAKALKVCPQCKKQLREKQ